MLKIVRLDKKARAKNILPKETYFQWKYANSFKGFVMGKILCYDQAKECFVDKLISD